MATGLLDDELWRLIEPLLPVRKRRFRHPGRKRLDDRRTRTVKPAQRVSLLADRGYDSKALPQELRTPRYDLLTARKTERHRHGVIAGPSHEHLLAQPPLAYPLRADGRNTRSLPQPRLLPHLPPDTLRAILLGALSSVCVTIVDRGQGGSTRLASCRLRAAPGICRRAPPPSPRRRRRLRRAWSSHTGRRRPRRRRADWFRAGADRDQRPGWGTPAVVE